MSIRLGELMVEQGTLTIEQCEEILVYQRKHPRPFGLIAEERFGISPGDIEQAWASQYAMIAPRIDPLSIEVHEQTLALITKRQAWQFGLLPVLEHEGEIEFVTATECLARALRFVGWRMTEQCSFAICEFDTLKMGLSMHYPFEALDSGLADQFLRNRPAA